MVGHQGSSGDLRHPLLNLWHDIDVGVQPPTSANGRWISNGD
jgi:hypothetical protein